MRIKKRTLLLLEVIIAMALVSLIAIPMIYPQTYILKQQKTFIQKVELDRLISLLFTQVVVDLYLNEIPWSVIASGQEVPIDSQMIQKSGFNGNLPYTATYKFQWVRQKPEPEEAYTLFLFNLVFTFTPSDKSKPITTTYLLFISRDLRANQQQGQTPNVPG